MNDINGRQYAKLSQLKHGTKVELDDGFPCMEYKSTVVKIIECECGCKSLMFKCQNETTAHFIDDHITEDGSIIGIYLVN